MNEAIKEHKLSRHTGFKKIFMQFLYWFPYSIFFIAYLIPPFVVMMNRNYFTYVNAWDEETYLSYQGALAAKDQVGYYILYVIKWLHELGISGGIQNLLFDIFVPVTLLILLYLIFRSFKFDPSEARVYSIIMSFGSVLFNKANPLIRDFITQNYYITNEGSWFLSGIESYVSILRTPNPQLSYFLIVLFAYVGTKTRKWIWLLAPLPLLYFHVAIPYAYTIVALWYLDRRKEDKILFKTIILLLISIILALIIKIGAFIMINKGGVVSSFDPFFTPIPHALISLTMIVSILFWGVTSFFYALKRIKLDRQYQDLFLLGFMLNLFLANQHLVSGSPLSPKNFQDYGASVIVCLLLVLTLNCFKQAITKSKTGMIIFKGFNFSVLMCILILVMGAYGFQFDKMQYKIFLNYNLTTEQVEKIKSNSLDVLISDQLLSGKMSLIAPKIIAPVFSYQYSFPSINRLNPYSNETMLLAYKFYNSSDNNWNDAENKIFSASCTNYFNVSKKFEQINYSRLDDPNLQSSDQPNFYFLYLVPEQNIWGYFPSHTN